MICDYLISIPLHVNDMFAITIYDTSNDQMVHHNSKRTLKFHYFCKHVKDNKMIHLFFQNENKQEN